MLVKCYSAPWGRKIWLITGAVLLLGFGLAVALPLAVPAHNAEDRWTLGIAPFVILFVVGGTALWTIRRFELTNDALVVRRLLWANQISLSQIESAGIDPDACKGAWKTRGNDGLFAMHGRFRSKRLGKFQAYVTNPANAIVLKVPGDTIVISPERPRSFLNELNRRLDRLNKKR